ncbi:MAG TPA: alanine racemase [Candidatus Limnocylindria bacterium]|nr:alanine racemase [Candidatus Limnocylindria bacterium]
MTGRSPHRAWIEVDHAALAGNLRALRRLAGEQRTVIAVVKANAYGHGAVPVARSLLAAGAERLAVATVAEGVALRRAGIEAPVLVLWGVGTEEARLGVEAGLELTVTDERGVEMIESAAAAGGHAPVHLKLDSGLGRQGVAADEALALAARVAGSRRLRLAGTYSHLAVPGEDDAYTDAQSLRLATLLDGMRSAGIDPGLVHMAASGGILAGLRIGDAIRPGLALYGLLPDWWDGGDVGLRPVLSLKALPLRLFPVQAGGAIGYGLRFRAERRTLVATLGIGYGDGWPRVHANNGWVLVRGQRAPIVGAVSMDGLTVDVGEIDGVTYADEFVLIGGQGADRIEVDEVARQRRTINYEVTTALRGRLPRIHLGADREE